VDHEQHGGFLARKIAFVAGSLAHPPGRFDPARSAGTAAGFVEPWRPSLQGQIKQEGAMKLHKVKERLEVHDSDLSGSVFDDVNLSGTTVENVNLSGCSFHNVNLSGASFDDLNMSGWRVHDVNLAGLKIDKANLAGASITHGRMEGMTIDGILLSELLAAYHAGKSGKESN
jgi:hypothetical protein